MKKNKVTGLIAILLFCFVFSHCDKHVVSPTQDLMGVTIGAKKEPTEERLKKIGFFVRDDRRRQEVWEFRDNKNYNYISLGYDRSEKVRYVTAFAHKQIKADGATNSKISALIKTEPIRYDQFGDLSKARQNVFMGDKEYVWDVPANGDVPAYLIIARGVDPTFANSCSLVVKKDPQSGDSMQDEDEDEERERESEKNDADYKKK